MKVPFTSPTCSASLPAPLRAQKEEGSAGGIFCNFSVFSGRSRVSTLSSAAVRGCPAPGAAALGSAGTARTEPNRAVPGHRGLRAAPSGPAPRATLRLFPRGAFLSVAVKFAHRNSGGAVSVSVPVSGAPKEGTVGHCGPGKGRTPCRKFAEGFTVFLQIFMLSAGNKKTTPCSKRYKLARFVFGVGCVFESSRERLERWERIKTLLYFWLGFIYKCEMFKELCGVCCGVGGLCFHAQPVCVCGGEVEPWGVPNLGPALRGESCLGKGEISFYPAQGAVK